MPAKNLKQVSTYIHPKTLKELKQKMGKSTCWSLSDYLRGMIIDHIKNDK